MQRQVAYIRPKMDTFLIEDGQHHVEKHHPSIAHSPLYTVETIIKSTVYDIIFGKSNIPFSLSSVATFSISFEVKGMEYHDYSP